MQEEIWKDVIGWEGLYRVSNLGRVMSLGRDEYCYNGKKFNRRSAIIKNHPHKGGYEKVALTKKYNVKRMFVHRVVAEAFIPNPENKPEVNHKNSIRNDNRLENLEWVTKSENSIHGYRDGLHFGKRGAESYHRKSVVQFTMDWEYVNEYCTAQEANKATGTYFVNISLCCHKKREHAGGYRWMFATDYYK